MKKFRVLEVSLKWFESLTFKVLNETTELKTSNKKSAVVKIFTWYVTHTTSITCMLTKSSIFETFTDLVSNEAGQSVEFGVQKLFKYNSLLKAQHSEH